MTCEFCEQAVNNPRLDQFTAGCDSCLGRALAATGAHEDSEIGGRLTARYREVLRAVFGRDREMIGRAEVKAWVTRLKQHKAQYD